MGRTIELKRFENLGEFWNNDWGCFNVPELYRTGDYWCAEVYSCEGFDGFEPRKDQYIFKGEIEKSEKFNIIDNIPATGAGIFILQRK